MVPSICRETSNPTGVTHCVAAYWMHSREDAAHPNVIVAKTTQLEVYSYETLSTSAVGQDASSFEPSPGNSMLELQAVYSFFGEVKSMAALPGRAHGTRDALVVAFGQVLPPGKLQNAPRSDLCNSLDPFHIPHVVTKLSAACHAPPPALSCGHLLVARF